MTSTVDQQKVAVRHEPPAPRPTPSLRARRARLGLIYSTPMAVVVGLLFVVPLVLMVWMSFNKWPLLGASRFNGGANYSVVSDQLFRSALVYTLVYTAITTVVLSLVALGLALLVQGTRRGTGFFRTVFFLPSAVGFGTAALLFVAMFNNDIGPFAPVLRFLGLGDGNVDWLGTTTNATFSVIGMVIWRFAGFNMLLLMVGLQAIDPVLYEAARMDGAGHWQTFRRITLPLMRPSIALMLVLSVTGSLLAFDQFFVLTQGRLGTATLVISVYQQAFAKQDLGKAAALSVIILVGLVVINVGQLIALRRGNN